MSTDNFSSELDIENLEKKFKAFDLDGNKTLNKNEFEILLFQMGYKNKHLNHAIYIEHDADCDELISFDGIFKIFYFKTKIFYS